MSRTHTAATVTGRRQPNVAELAADVTEQVLQPRRTYLKHRAPRSPYVHSLRRKMASGFVRPAEMRLAVAFADVEDGIPTSLVLQAYRTEIALIEEYARALAAEEPIVAPHTLLAFIQREGRAQAEQDAAERELIANPHSAEAHERLLIAEEQYHAVNERKVAVVRASHARLTIAARSVS